MVTLGEIRDTRTFDLQFLWISSRSIYDRILGRPFTEMLNVVASLVHLKLKYHNVYDESTMICVNPYKAQRIHKFIHRDQKGKEKAGNVNQCELPHQPVRRIGNPTLKIKDQVLWLIWCEWFWLYKCRGQLRIKTKVRQGMPYDYTWRRISSDNIAWFKFPLSHTYVILFYFKMNE